MIIGNGLGMSLSPDDFSLTRVMPSVWEESLTPVQKSLISSCIDGIEVDGPTHESQLMARKSPNWDTA